MAKKTIGLTILFIIGLPLLVTISITWGISKALTSPETHNSISRHISTTMPKLVDNSYLAITTSKNSDPDFLLWKDAISNTSPKPSQILQEAGIFDWVATELPNTTNSIPKILDSKSDKDQITLNTTGLKFSMTNPAIVNYLVAVFDNLPTCSPAQLAAWESFVINNQPFKDIPACNPQGLSQKSISTILNSLTKTIPDNIVLIQNQQIEFFRLLASTKTFFLAVPLTIIFLGATIFQAKPKNILTLTGITLAISGVTTALIAATAKNLDYLLFDLESNLSISLNGNPHPIFKELSAEFAKFLLEKIVVVLDLIFSPTLQLSAFFIGIGVILIFISRFISRTNNSSTSRSHMDPSKLPNTNQTAQLSQNPPKPPQSGEKELANQSV